MEKFNRAVRRHHVARLKAKRRHFWGWSKKEVDHMHGLIISDHMPPNVLGKAVHTPQMCSCLGCGNQRHNTGGWTPTIQEVRWAHQYYEQLDEVKGIEDGPSFARKVARTVAR